MNRYTAYFSTKSKHALGHFKADNPKDALRLALAYDQAKLDYRPVSEKSLAVIRILDEDDNELAHWYSPQQRLELWSYLLLRTLKEAEIALSAQPNVSVPSLHRDTSQIVKRCREVIALAEGRHP